MTATLYRWFRPGEAHGAGWTFTGCVSRWPDTGEIRAELWAKDDWTDIEGG